MSVNPESQTPNSPGPSNEEQQLGAADKSKSNGFPVAAILGVLVLLVVVAVGAVFFFTQSNEEETSSSLAEEITAVNRGFIQAHSFEEANQYFCSAYQAEPNDVVLLDELLEDDGSFAEVFGTEEWTEQDIQATPESVQFTNEERNEATWTDQPGSEVNYRKEGGAWKICDAQLDLRELGIILRQQRAMMDPLFNRF